MRTKEISKSINKQILNRFSLLLRVSRQLLYVQVNRLSKACYLKYLDVTCMAVQPNLWVYVYYYPEFFIKFSSNLVSLLKKKWNWKRTTFWLLQKEVKFACEDHFLKKKCGCCWKREICLCLPLFKCFWWKNGGFVRKIPCLEYSNGKNINVLRFSE